MHFIVTGGVSQKQLEEAPRANVERLARWLIKNGSHILIDPNMDQKSLASRVYWSMTPFIDRGMY